jgi:hypothetical protein
MEIRNISSTTYGDEFAVTVYFTDGTSRYFVGDQNFCERNIQVCRNLCK